MKLTLEELAVVSDLHVQLRYPDCNGNYMFSFQHCGMRHGTNMLLSSCGRGTTPDRARNDYAQIIRGQTLIINAGTDDRREIHVPSTLQ